MQTWLRLLAFSILTRRISIFASVLQAFLSQSTDKNKFEIKEALMPDSMHPSTVGMRIIATRLEPVISKLLMSPLGKHSSDALAII